MVMVTVVCFAQVIAQRLSKLQSFSRRGLSTRIPAEVLIKRKRRGKVGEAGWEVVRARGHLDEVQELSKGGSKLGELQASSIAWQC
jgi:cGMP-dependent protein kinase 2